jgi:protein-L-isoaspartate O-methyltransferase
MTPTDPDWQPHAAALATMLANRANRWHPVIADTPRHLLVPNWYRGTDGGWDLRRGEDDHEAWMQTAYRNTNSVITRIGALHADHAEPGDRAQGRPTSSSTNPWLVLQMYRHAQVYPGAEVLDVGTGSGYGAALLAGLLGDAAVTSIDVDPYLTKVAAERLDEIGLHPRILTGDATAPLDWEGDRIVAMVAVPTVPASWLAALREGGRLVTTLAGANIIVTARKMDDGTAWGMVEFDRAGFMVTRDGEDYEPERPGLFDAAEHHDGEVHMSSHPVIDISNAWEIGAVLRLTAPGIQHRYSEDADGRRTALMAHADGSWARAVGRRGEHAEVHQGGPRQLWEFLDVIRADWLADGYLQLYGAEVRIKADGTMRFSRGKWNATLGPTDAA